MVGDPSEIALARIEAALARIETAAQRPAPASAGDYERHVQFRASVVQTLHELDAVIAGLESE